ncbi:MAG: hypothetical protein ACLQDV_18545 [Candidatus Binataceae bacterium]
MVAVLVVIIALPPVAACAGDYVVRRGQELSLSFHGAPLKTVLERLQRDAQITVTVPQGLLDRKVSVNLSNVATDAALATLFRSAALNNFAIVHEPGMKAHITVVLLEDGKDRPTLPAAAEAEVAEGAGVSEGAPITPEMRAMLIPPPGAPNDPRLLDPDSTVVVASEDFAAAQQAIPAFVPAATEPAPPPAADLPHEPMSRVPGVEGEPMTTAMRQRLSIPSVSSR